MTPFQSVEFNLNRAIVGICKFRLASASKAMFSLLHGTRKQKLKRKVHNGRMCVGGGTKMVLPFGKRYRNDE